MEHSIQQSQGPAMQLNEPCNPGKCATCFENHGCMFEQYMAGSINMVDHQLEQKPDAVNPKRIESLWLFL